MKVECYEIFLSSGGIDATKWQDFLRAVAEYLHFGDCWRISARLDGVTLRYYLESPRPLPSSLGLADFLLKSSPLPSEIPNLKLGALRLYHPNDDSLALIRHLASRRRKFRRIVFDFRAFRKKFSTTTYLVYCYHGQNYIERLTCCDVAKILAANFAQNKSYNFKKFPKYLKNDKTLKLLRSDPVQSLFEVDSFPYREQKRFLGQADYDFEKHSVVLGSSGSGKSKFLASFIDQIYQNTADQYRVVVIDPHDSLRLDCQHIPSRRVIDFCAAESSINLFQNNLEDVNISVELTLTLFRSLMSADYNTQLERVLRFASYLLMSSGQFSFLRLRRLLTDLEFCDQTVSELTDRLPDAVTRFFLADFSELRTKSYAVAIAPIVAFIDEMQMVPVFNQDAELTSLPDNIQNNFLSIYSLSRPKLGQKVIQTIAGLLLQQLFLFAQRKAISEHLIVIIDEVATIENPILARFLSELRKYQTSLILVGQYFDQFSPELREAIFANAANYYIFRVSKRDAELLVKNLNIKLASSDKIEDQQSVLTSLKDRECLVQVSKAGEVYPACKTRTLDFIAPAPQPANSPIVAKSDKAISTSASSQILLASSPVSPKVQLTLPKAQPSTPKTQLAASKTQPTSPKRPLSPPVPPRHFEFSFDDSVHPEDIMRVASTSRKVLTKEPNNV